MPKRSMKQDDPLEDFSRREITLDGVSKHVYVAGSGPAVIVMTEMPGISPEVGAVGMCFTGNFALTMMLEPAMLAPVLSQPSLPLNDPAGIEIAPDEIKAVRDRKSVV